MKRRKALKKAPKIPLKWVALGLVVLAILVLASLVRETIRSRQIDREIVALHEEAESLRVRNFEIALINRSLDDSDFLEREARTKLGMRREGEQVVVLGGGEARSLPSEILEDGPSMSGQDDWSNPKMWWMYFADRRAYDDYAVTYGNR